MPIRLPFEGLLLSDFQPPMLISQHLYIASLNLCVTLIYGDYVIALFHFYVVSIDISSQPSPEDQPPQGSRKVALPQASPHPM